MHPVKKAIVYVICSLSTYGKVPSVTGRLGPFLRSLRVGWRLPWQCHIGWWVPAYDMVSQP